MAANRTQYTTVAIILHWLIAATIVFQVIVGWRMGDGPKGSPTTFALFQLHKSIGITILLLSLARLAWRLVNPAPLGPEDQPRWERIASKTVHLLFYVIMIGLPLTGWIMVSASRVTIPTLLYGVIPWPHIPGLPELAAGPKHLWHEVGELGHGVLVKLTYVLLALHLGAVAKHQILDRDAVLAHMAPGARPGWREPRAWLAAAGFDRTVDGSFAVKIKAAPPPPTAAEPAPVESPAQTKPVQPTPADTAAPAAPTAPALKDPVAWSVQKGSTLGFAASWSGNAIEGQFTRWTADILFSPEALDRSKLTVSVDMASAKTGDDQRDASLPGGDFFDAADHPKAVFTATKFRKTGEGKFVADGTLDLRGVRKPLSLPFSLKIDGDSATARGVTTLDRTMFGVGQGEWASTDQIAGKVKVSVSLTAKRK
ncbi:YceI family protein [uncultured Caulobacter sp.]|uniref:YceI family protein n=1 Tax=uncultured Caulobacter sp. TaxID=158749 RepID=UPI002637A2C4|nr:YceI family protein [uncultured Caulobacter sp.]